MQLPKDVTEKVAVWLKSTDNGRLRKANQQLTHQYQTRQQPISFQTLDQHLAYVAARMPATYSVCRSVLTQISSFKLDLESMLDLGAGPGTASLAVLDLYSHLTELTLLDKDPFFLSLATKLLPKTGRLIHYATVDISCFAPQKDYDLVFCSYVLNEVKKEDLTRIVIKAWGMTKQVLVLVEPGTPLGFSILKKARQLLIDIGAYVIAPCTHHDACSLKENDWCHFAAQVDRSEHHRLTKQADMPYETEKYSYVIFARQPFPRPSYRIIKRPLHRSGHVIFDLCGESGVHRSTVSKKHKDHYTRARKQIWGNGWDEENG